MIPNTLHCGLGYSNIIENLQFVKYVWQSIKNPTRIYQIS